MNQVKYQNPATQTYLGSPSIVCLPGGDLLAAHDYFGPGCPRNHEHEEHLTSVYRSYDDGRTWANVTHIANAYWSNLFVLGEDVYLLGTSQQYGSIVIRRSCDGGMTWTHPADETSGLLFRGGPFRQPPNYHTAPLPALVTQGRIYRAFEDCTPCQWPSGFQSCVIAADVEADLLAAENWVMSNKLPFDPASVPEKWGRVKDCGWLEGNVVIDPAGHMWNLLRFRAMPTDSDAGHVFDKAVMLTIEQTQQGIRLGSDRRFIDFPGGHSKFTVRYDDVSGLYLTLSNGNLNPEKPTLRAVLSLYNSTDLIHWNHAKVLLDDEAGYRDPLHIGFQYVDWQFDGDDLIYLVRTAYDGAPNYHDANRITFHKLKGFRRVISEQCTYPLFWRLPLQSDIQIKSTPDHYNVVSEELAGALQSFSSRLHITGAGYPQVSDWSPGCSADWGLFPQAPVERSVIYQGNADTWAYSHHQTITKFGDKYVASWSNGRLHEDYPGQQVHYAWSTDALTWSQPKVLVSTPDDSLIVRNNGGLLTANGKLYCYVCVGQNMKRAGSPTMDNDDPAVMSVDVYETTDLERWTHHESIVRDTYIFEAPRVTRSGRLLLCSFNFADRHTQYLIWDDVSAAADPPRVLDLPPGPGGVLAEQGTWFQDDSGRIWAWQRDGSVSYRLGLSWSDDEGDTWSELRRTDFPNTYSRPYAGRLSDGRFFIVGNNYDAPLNRLHLQVALCDPGGLFSRQYTLVSGPTTRRINGRHKEDGWQYPNCLVDGDKLLTIHSINKEDVGVCIADMSKVQ